MEIQVKVIKILGEQRFTSKKNGKEYVRNSFVGETNGQYPKRVAFTVMDEEKYKQMGIVVGGSYSVSFDIDAREWNDKWFTDCLAWKAVRLDNAAQGQQQVQSSPQPQPIATPVENSSLPF